MSTSRMRRYRLAPTKRQNTIPPTNSSRYTCNVPTDRLLRQAGPNVKARAQTVTQGKFSWPLRWEPVDGPSLTASKLFGALRTNCSKRLGVKLGSTICSLRSMVAIDCGVRSRPGIGRHPRHLGPAGNRTGGGLGEHLVGLWTMDHRTTSKTPQVSLIFI
jgi:hypothetical protein